MPTRNRKNALYVKKYWQLYLLMVLPIIYFILFKYMPMLGNIIAFRRYRVGQSIFGSSWVGLRYFKMFFNDPAFWSAFKNTIILSVSNLLVNFPIPIVFALLLNELDSKRFKKLAQTVSYLPRFFSTVIIVSMMGELFSPTTGVVNELLKSMGIAPVYFMNEPAYFRALYVLSDTWQFTGYTAVIYLAAIAGISSDMYEAAMIDGANRWKQTLYVTLPSIMPTIVVMLVLRIGQLMTVSFEKVLLMYTPANSKVSDIIDTMVYRVGLTQSNFSYATAVGLFGALIGFTLVVSANFFSKKITGEGLY